VSLSAQLRSNKSEAGHVVRTHWQGSEMRQDGFLESGTLGMLKRRLGRRWGSHEAETSVWLGSWWLLTGLAF
jgi:hypothetical protein